MSIRYAALLVIAPLYVGAATVFVGFHHLPHILDMFYGSVVLAPVSIVCGLVALDWRIAIPLYLILFAEFLVLAITMSPPSSLASILIGSVVAASINVVPQALLYVGGRAVGPKLVRN